MDLTPTSALNLTSNAVEIPINLYQDTTGTGYGTGFIPVAMPKVSMPVQWAKMTKKSPP